MVQAWPLTPKWPWLREWVWGKWWIWTKNGFLTMNDILHQQCLIWIFDLEMTFCGVVPFVIVDLSPIWPCFHFWLFIFWLIRSFLLKIEENPEWENSLGNHQFFQRLVSKSNSFWRPPGGSHCLLVTKPKV